MTKIANRTTIGTSSLDVLYIGEDLLKLLEAKAIPKTGRIKPSLRN